LIFGDIPKLLEKLKVNFMESNKKLEEKQEKK
jgi:hypothetical protein